MSLPPHREKNAKVEGRDPPETVKETMEPFKMLMGRLLEVPISELQEQKRLYDAKKSRDVRTKTLRPLQRRQSPNVASLQLPSVSCGQDQE